MKNLNVILVFSILLLSGQAISHAQPGSGLGLEGGREMVEILDLTPEQVDALKCENPGQGRELKENIIRGKQVLNDMIRDKTISDIEIHKQLEEINQMQFKFNNYRLERILKARNVLSHEQLEKLLELKESRSGAPKGPHFGKTIRP